jgi:D-arabinose 1-dehydrogenase-like Zn-dependent alcohol dehydrogenase
MLAAQLVAPGRFAVQHVEIPEPAAGEVLLEVAGCGLCGSDVSVTGDHKASSCATKGRVSESCI